MQERLVSLAVLFVWCLALVTCAAAQPSQGAPPSSAPPPASPPLTGGASSILQDVEALAANVRAQTQELESLIARMQALLASRPQPPAVNASDDEKKRYQQALDQWKAQVIQLEKAIDSKRQALDQTLGRLNAAAAQLPPDRRQQADSARKSAEQTRAKAQSLLAALRQERSGAKTQARTPVDRQGLSPVKGAVP